MPEVYKVCAKIEGKYFSASVPRENQFCLEYGLNKTTHPPEFFPDAWLLAFKDEKSARRFSDNQAIFRAETSEIMEVGDRIADYFEFEDDLFAFWKGDPVLDRSRPSGTVFCRDITPLELIRPST